MAIEWGPATKAAAERQAKAIWEVASEPRHFRLAERAEQGEFTDYAEAKQLRRSMTSEEQDELKDAAIAMLVKVACRTSASYEYEIDVLRGALRDGLAIVNNISMAVKFADDKAAFNAFSAWVDQARAAIDRTDWRAPDFKAEGGT